MKNILITSKELKQYNWKMINNLMLENNIQPIFNKTDKPMSADEICEICLQNSVEGIIVYSSSDEISSKVFEKCKDLKVVSRHGVGIENIDVEAAEKHGVQVKTTNNLFDYETVADLTFGLIICIARHISKIDKALKNNKWIRPMGKDVWKKTLGIVGYGRIGRAVTRRAKAFKMKVIAYDPYVNIKVAEGDGIELVSLEYLLKTSDFISLHLPLNKQTQNIIDSKELSLMKKDAYLINTARAGLVNQNALLTALKNREIAGAAVDVYTVEPAVKDPLIQSNLDNLVLTSHIGSYTIENLKEMDYAVIKNAIDVINNDEKSEEVI